MWSIRDIGDPAGHHRCRTVRPISTTTQDLEPEENESLEAGAKFQLFDDKAAGAGLGFPDQEEQRQDHRPDIGNDDGRLWRQPGSATASSWRIAGAITDEWSFNASWAFIGHGDNRIDDGRQPRQARRLRS